MVKDNEEEGDVKFKIKDQEFVLSYFTKRSKNHVIYTSYGDFPTELGLTGIVESSRHEPTIALVEHVEDVLDEFVEDIVRDTDIVYQEITEFDTQNQ